MDVPRERGDEPWWDCSPQLGVKKAHVPRERGDEPVSARCSVRNDAIHVPRERGDEPYYQSTLPTKYDHHVPRERGDEPRRSFLIHLLPFMFPASAGMNRPSRGARSRHIDVPRERGDEPTR